MALTLRCVIPNRIIRFAPTFNIRPFSTKITKSTSTAEQSPKNSRTVTMSDTMGSLKLSIEEKKCPSRDSSIAHPQLWECIEILDGSLTLYNRSKP